MFHNGFEWTVEKPEAFEALIEKHGWDQFFTCSTKNDRPWIYYLTNDTINAMSKMVEGVLDGLGLFAKGLPFELTSES
jgi:hypothetical protein